MKTIVDIGAHTGLFAIYALRQFPDARVHCFEPDPGNAGYLRRNLELNALSERCVLEETAVGSDDGKVILFEYGRKSDFSLYELRSSTRSQTVPIRSFSRLLKEEGPFDLLKVDAEGAEHEMFHSVPPEMLASIRAIVGEFHDVVDKDGEQQSVEALGVNAILS